MENDSAVSQSASLPSILLVSAYRWSMTARLACGYLELGCRVAAVCRVTGNPIRKVRGLKAIYPYAGLSPLESLRTAIVEFAPDIIVPVCDRSVQHLHDLHLKSSSGAEVDRHIRALIEKSLGPPASFPIVSSRYDLLMLAKDQGIAVPETTRVESIDDLKRWNGHLPCLLKADGSFSGRGVRRVETVTGGEDALLVLTGAKSLFQLIKGLLLDRDRDWTISDWAGARPGIIAQAIVPGRPANCSVACWRGRILAGIAVEVVEAEGPTNPAIVVQIVDGREMLEAAERIAGRLELTGFFGLDFILEEGTGKLNLIEMNPRCTPPCTTNLGNGRDLLGAFWASLTRREMPQRPAATEKSRIAYFPAAVVRGALSVDISGPNSVYLDVPIGDPELVEELLHPWSERSLLGRLVDRIRGRWSKRQASLPHIFELA